MLSAETRATLCRSVVDVVVMYDDDTDEESWQSRRCDLQLVMDSLMLFLQPGRVTFYVLAGKRRKKKKKKKKKPIFEAEIENGVCDFFSSYSFPSFFFHFNFCAVDSIFWSKMQTILCCCVHLRNYCFFCLPVGSVEKIRLTRMS